jgi:hypothetical protein
MQRQKRKSEVKGEEGRKWKPYEEVVWEALLIRYHTCSQLPIVKVSLVQFRAKLAVLARENIATPSNFVGINVPGTHKSAQSVLGACLLCKLNERGSFVCPSETTNVTTQTSPSNFYRFMHDSYRL